MTRIIYKKRFNALPDEEGALILKEITGVGTSCVEISLEEFPAGYVTVSDISAKTKCGVATLDLSTLPDGLYTPIFVTGAAALLCSPFIKRQNVLIRPLPDGGDISRLELLIGEGERRISCLESDIAKMKALIEGAGLTL